MVTLKRDKKGNHTPFTDTVIGYAIKRPSEADKLDDLEPGDYFKLVPGEALALETQADKMQTIIHKNMSALAQKGNNMGLPMDGHFHQFGSTAGNRSAGKRSAATPAVEKDDTSVEVLGRGKQKRRGKVILSPGD